MIIVRLYYGGLRGKSMDDFCRTQAAVGRLFFFKQSAIIFSWKNICIYIYIFFILVRLFAAAVAAAVVAIAEGCFFFFFFNDETVGWPAETWPSRPGVPDHLLHHRMLGHGGESVRGGGCSAFHRSRGLDRAASPFASPRNTRRSSVYPSVGSSVRPAAPAIIPQDGRAASAATTTTTPAAAAAAAASERNYGTSTPPPSAVAAHCPDPPQPQPPLLPPPPAPPPPSSSPQILRPQTPPSPP